MSTGFLTALIAALAFSGPALACPPGTLQGMNANDCYRVHFSYADWQAAENECVSDGGHLASVSNAFTQKLLYNISSDVRGVGDYVWLGGQNQGSQWTWSDGSPWTYTNWYGTQPTGIGCLLMRASDGNWFSGGCGTTTTILCRLSNGASGGKPTLPPNLPTISTPTPPPPCLDGWTYNPQTDLCYGVMTTQVTTVYNAISICANNNAALVSVSDIASNYAVLSYAIAGGITAEYLHLGLTFNATVGKWTWDDGRHATFTNWSPGYPQDATNNIYTFMKMKDFVVGQWVNNDQYTQAGILCERRPDY